MSENYNETDFYCERADFIQLEKINIDNEAYSMFDDYLL